MDEEKTFKIVIARPAKIRYQENILPYLLKHFSLERAVEIDDNILRSTRGLNINPNRGSIEKYLVGVKEKFRFILHKETKYFEIKIIYYINKEKNTVFVTDFFPTKMNPQKILKNK